MDILEAKLRKLALEDNKANTNSLDANKTPLEAQLKSALKELSTYDFDLNATDAKQISNFLKELIEKFNQDIKSQVQDQEHDTVSHALTILKLIGETPLPKIPSFNGIPATTSKEIKGFKKDHFWTEVMLPNLSDIYEFLQTFVLSFCDKTLVETSSSSTTSTSNLTSESGGGDADISISHTGGFAHHQLLGLLQKGVQVVIVFLKRGTLNPKTWNQDQDQDQRRLNETLHKIGSTLCNLLGHVVELGLDIRCNIGLAICHLVHHVLKGDKAKILRYYEFLLNDSSSIFPLSESTGTEMSESREDFEFLHKVKVGVRNEVSRIGLTVGIFSSLEFQDDTVDFSELLYAIGKNILEIDHGTKEFTNLGVARALEALSQRLSNPSIPLPVLVKLSTLFGPLEFFIFSYIPGHIAAVKNSCRNMLACLTRIYDRIMDENITLDGSLGLGGKPKSGSGDLIEGLLRKVLSKDAHVKWIGLACVTKNSSKSVKVLELDPDMPLSLLSAKRTHTNPANESYIALMSYEFKTLPLKIWEQRWVAPLFLSQLSLKDESCWPQKKAIISAILYSHKRNAKIEIMLSPILRFIIANMNSKSSKAKTCEDDGESHENENWTTEAALLAAETIKVASELDLKLDFVTSQNEDEDSFRGLVSRSVLNSWLWNNNPQIRLAGFSLLAESKKTSELITQQDFKSLKILLKYSLVSQNPAYRQQFIAYFKKLLIRLRDGQALVKRKKNSTALKHYEDFFHWIWIFLTESEGLFPGANFGRRCLSLECLAELVAVFPDFSVFGLKPDFANIKYLHWLVDSYENNKMRALDVLAKMPMPAFSDPGTCNAIFHEALALCESIKPPDSVTGRYLMVLLMKQTKDENQAYSPLKILDKLFEKLQDTLQKIRETSLTEVSCTIPMYGLIRCIRMILNETEDYLKYPKEYKEYSEKLINLLLIYDNIVFPLLGSDAPEGSLPGLPDSADNCQVIRSITAQMVLVCSWRSMRDTCLLMADMCCLFPLEGERVNLKKNPSGDFILSFDQVSNIGSHMLHLLSTLVHRGVFEQVFVGFKTFATRLWKSSNPKLSNLPGKYLEDIMNEEQINSKCITRRSAGLPYLFQALLSAESDNEAFFRSWVQRLFIKDESKEKSSLRVHAMNILRGLFRDANFSKAMMPFVPDGLGIAFKGLKSENWNERNSGLMLYGAVLRRAFGPKLNLMSAPTFFRKFPQMYDFLLGELKSCLVTLKGGNLSPVCEEAQGSEISPSGFTFHLLLLLSSFAPAGRVEDDHFKLAEFIPMLRKCAASSDIEVRKLAAKAIIPFLGSPNDTSVALSILKELQDCDLAKASMNYLHGSFTQVAVVLKYITKDQSISEIIDILPHLFPDQFWKIASPTVYESLAEIILAVEDYSNPSILKLYHKLTSKFDEKFPLNMTQSRNSLPGLPVADSRISQVKVAVEFAKSKSSGAEEARKLVYTWMNEAHNDSLMEELLEYLCASENEILTNDIFNSNSEFQIANSCVVIHSLVKCYMNSNVRYIGQSALGFKYLDILTTISPMSYNYWLKSVSIENDEDCDSAIAQQLVDRITQICIGNSATTEHKRSSLRVLCKFAFQTDFAFTKELQRRICQLLVDWSDSSTDDDLRFGAALSIRNIPFANMGKFSIVDQGMIWLSILKLIQDDDPQVRSIICSKISTDDVELEESCDRKSLERLTDIYFENYVKLNPLTGLALLVGLLFRDDFDLKAEDSNDDEEGRLFDKSEMNTFCEPITFSKTLQYNMTRNSINFKEYFNTPLSIELVELYELANNSKLFISSPTLKSIIEIIGLKLQYDNSDSDDDLKLLKETVRVEKAFCSHSSPLITRVQTRIIAMFEQFL